MSDEFLSENSVTPEQVRILDSLAGQQNATNEATGMYMGRPKKLPPRAIVEQLPPEEPRGVAALPATYDLQAVRVQSEAARARLVSEAASRNEPAIVATIDLQRQQWRLNPDDGGKTIWHVVYYVGYGPSNFEDGDMDVWKSVFRNDNMDSQPDLGFEASMPASEQAFVKTLANVSAEEAQELITYLASAASANHAADIPDTVPTIW